MNLATTLHNLERSSHPEPPLDGVERKATDDSHLIQQKSDDHFSPMRSLDNPGRPIDLEANSPRPENPHSLETTSYPRHAFSASSPLNFEDFETIEVPIPTPPESSRASSLYAVNEGKALGDLGESSLGQCT